MIINIKQKHVNQSGDYLSDNCSLYTAIKSHLRKSNISISRIIVRYSHVIIGTSKYIIDLNAIDELMNLTKLPLTVKLTYSNEVAMNPKFSPVEGEFGYEYYQEKTYENNGD
tara:strand:- start:1644 stop:1979 length:336 start_codon:yes stop_codon:yes gene_type:complete